MTDAPRVSVVIPTYNRAELLAESIESVLRQSYRDLEVVVCDDGSTDDTAARVQALESRVRYLGLPHTGRPGSPRNRGIEAARGELVAFLDDDDLWEPDKLARQIELMDRGGLSFVYTDRRLLFSDGSQSAPVATPALPGSDRFMDLVLQGQFPSVCTVLMQRSLLRQVNGFDETLETAEDLDLWLRLGRIARAGRVPEPLVLVRRRAGTLSDRSGPLAFRNAIEILQRALATQDLQPSELRVGHATLARLHARLAARLARQGDLAGSLRAAFGSIRQAAARLGR
jgi:GT2 family glycosyltransferase